MADAVNKSIAEGTFEDLHEFFGTYWPRLTKKEESLGEKILRFFGCNREQLYLEEREYSAFQAADISDSILNFLSTQQYEVSGLDRGYGEGSLATLFGSAREIPLVLERVQIGLHEEKGVMTNALVYVSGKESDDHFILLIMSAGGFLDGKSIVVGYIRRKDERVSYHASAFYDTTNRWMKDRSCYKGKALRPVTSYGSIKGYEFIEFPRIRREQIILDNMVWESLERNLLLFHAKRDDFRKSKIALKRGILLTGDPGTGKTLLCQHIAGVFTGYTALHVPAVATDSLASLVTMAKALQPALVILEDIDLVAGERKENRAKAVLGELMNQMEGFSVADDVVFLCTTNHLQDIEPAIIARPGRIDHIIELPRPNKDLRRQLFQLYTAGIFLSADMERWVNQTDGFTPAAMKELVKKAGSASLLAGVRQDGKIKVTDVHLQAAFQDLTSQLKRIESLQHKQTRRKTGKKSPKR